MRLGAGLSPVKPQLAGVQTGEDRKALLRSVSEHQSILGQQNLSAQDT